MPNPHIRRTLLGVVAGAAVAGLCGLAEAASTGWGDVAAVGLILVVGFPHGAADLATLSDLRLGSGTAGRLGLYLAAMGLTAALWWWAPVLGLLAFLATAVVHFGQDQAASLGSAWRRLSGGRRWVYALAWGAFAVGAPLAWHPVAFAPVTEAMLGAHLPAGVLSAAAWGAGGAGALALGLAVDAGRRFGGRWWAEVGLLVALAVGYALLPGLWGFAAFFIGVHSATSVVNQLRWRGRRPSWPAVGAFLREGAPYAVLAVVGVIAAAVAEVGVAVTPAWLATFFVLVSVVTTPHAVVVFLAAERAGEAGGAVTEDRLASRGA